MGYQALLFCPNEKISRAVTQVLSELDFTVVPCVEPFAAVKKLMAERFDAVVVDCDNEQNAALLFKSARNTAGNQASLAVAVVEGQAGVAKAFRIGANLVLTKPINIDQAKGTLRVARGLLRKGEASKGAPLAKSAESKPADLKPAEPAPSTPTPKPAPQPDAMPFAPSAAYQVAEPRLSLKTSPIDAPAPTPAASAPSTTGACANLPRNAAATAWPTPTDRASELPARLSSPAFASGAASAPAPAREIIPAPDKREASAIPEPEPSEPEVLHEATPDKDSPSTKDAAEPSFPTLANAAEAKPGSGSRKAILAIAAIVVIAAAGYEAWMLWGSSLLNLGKPTHVAEPMAKPPVIAPVTLSTPVAETPAPDSASPETAGDPKAQQYKGADNSNKPKATSPGPKAPATKPAHPIVVKSGVSDRSSIEAPSVEMGGIVGAGDLPKLVATANAQAPVLQRVNVSQGVSRGLLVKQIQPAYPQNALMLRVEGKVQLLATVSKNGDISALKILSGDPILARSAADAVKQWKYKPYLLNGEPVEIQTEVTVNFTLPR
jgi:protein TonB